MYVIYFMSMNNLRILVTLCVVFISMARFGAVADHRVDSIRSALPTLNGDERLDALSNLAHMAHAGDDMEYEIRCIHDYLDEARRQNAIDAEGDASVALLYCFDNYEQPDSIKHYLPLILQRMKDNGSPDYYYNCWDASIQHDIFHNKPESALREAHKMYDDAREAGSNYGLGVAAFDIGMISQSMGRSEEAVKSFEESISRLSSEGDITVFLSAYNHLTSSLDALGRYDEMRKKAQDWKKVIDDYLEKAYAQGYISEFGGRRMYNTLAFCLAEMGSGNLEKAGEYLRKAQKYAAGRSASTQYRLMQVESRYYDAAGMYDKAIDTDHRNLELIESVGDSVSAATVRTHLAEVLFKAGRFKEAAETMRELSEMKDKIRNEELAYRLDELRTIYEVDSLTVKADAAHAKLFYSIVILALLLLALAILLVYQHSLRKKNRVLYNAIQKINRAEYKSKETAPSTDEPSPASADRDEEIYQKVCLLMTNDQVYKDPSLNREALSNAIGSNTLYLSNAIKQHTGLTINDFINDYRLRHAAVLLAANPSMTIGEVETRSGFNSRNTFTRLFRGKYGMSPSEYKRLSREQDANR